MARTWAATFAALPFCWAVAVVSCSRGAAPTPAATNPAPEVRVLVDDTKRYAESLSTQPAGNYLSSAQVLELSALLDRLLRHLEERAQASQAGGDPTQGQTQVAADVRQLRQLQDSLHASGTIQTTSANASPSRSPLDVVSENLGKLIQIAEQGQQLVGVVHPPKGDGAPAFPSAGPAADPSTSPATTGGVVPVSTAPSPSAQPSAPSGPTSAGACCDIVGSTAPLGRLGRLVIAYPEGANVTGSRADVFKAGDNTPIQGGWGAQTWELIGGMYAVTISGKRVEGVPVQAGHDTRLRVGVLRIRAGSSTRVDVTDVDGDASLSGGWGAQVIGLPAGTFRVRIAGQSESVTIAPARVTDF